MQLSVCVEGVTKHSSRGHIHSCLHNTGCFSLVIEHVSDTTTSNAVSDGPGLSMSDQYVT